MTKHPTFDVDELRAGLGELDATPAALSKRAAIKAMVQEIDAAIARGVTLPQIKAYLDGKGLDLQLNSLRQYVADARRNAPSHLPKQSRSRPPAKAKAPRSTSSPKLSDSGDRRPAATPGTDPNKFVNVSEEEL